MTIAKRQIKAPSTYCSINDVTNAKGSPPAEACRDAAAAEMVGVLGQLGMLACYATEMFKEIGDIATETNAGLARLGDRVEVAKAQVRPIETKLLSEEQHFNHPLVFYNTPATNWGEPRPSTQKLFAPETRSRMINSSYEDCQKPPAVHKLDRFNRHGPCMQKFSNPGFFYLEWVKDQEQLINEKIKEQKAKPNRKRGRKKAAQGNEQIARVKQAPTPISNMGPEFVGVKLNSPRSFRDANRKASRVDIVKLPDRSTDNRGLRLQRRESERTSSPVAGTNESGSVNISSMEQVISSAVVPQTRQHDENVSNSLDSRVPSTARRMQSEENSSGMESDTKTDTLQMPEEPAALKGREPDRFTFEFSKNEDKQNTLKTDATDLHSRAETQPSSSSYAIRRHAPPPPEIAPSASDLRVISSSFPSSQVKPSEPQVKPLEQPLPTEKTVSDPTSEMLSAATAVPTKGHESSAIDLAKYQRMQKIGLPEGAVKQAMRKDGVDPSFLFGEAASKSEGVLAAGATDSSATEIRDPSPDLQDPELQKYQKMQHIGLPQAAIVHAMTKDGVDPSRLFGSVGDGGDNQGAAAPVPQQQLSSPASSNPALAKYIKMQSIGLPQGAIEHAMMKDGIDPAELFGNQSGSSPAQNQLAIQNADGNGVKPAGGLPTKGNFLSAIQKGTTLKKAEAREVPTTATVDGGDLQSSLMAAIQKGATLKKVEATEVQPAATAGGDNLQSSLMAGILKGKPLKKVEPRERNPSAASPGLGGGASLLDAIRTGGSNLRKVERVADKRKESVASEVTGGGVAAILARRIAIMGKDNQGNSSSDSESGSEWDDDD